MKNLIIITTLLLLALVGVSCETKSIGMKQDVVFTTIYLNISDTNTGKDLLNPDNANHIPFKDILFTFPDEPERKYTVDGIHYSKPRLFKNEEDGKYYIKMHPTGNTSGMIGSGTVKLSKDEVFTVKLSLPNRVLKVGFLLDYFEGGISLKEVYIDEKPQWDTRPLIDRPRFFTAYL